MGLKLTIKILGRLYRFRERFPNYYQGKESDVSTSKKVAHNNNI